MASSNKNASKIKGGNLLAWAEERMPILNNISKRFIQEKPLELAKSLSDVLPSELNCTYLVNSGTEAIEGAIKLAKRKNGRKQCYFKTR